MNETLHETLRDYARAAAGGLVIGMPLLFTMEVWFHAFLLPWWKVLALVVVAFLLVLGYNSIAGFRRERTVKELILDSIATVGLGVIISFVALVVLGQIEVGTSLRDAAGKVALESIPVALGASVASAQFSGKPVGNSQWAPHAFERMLVGAGGALLFALNIAPTEEVVLLGVGASPIQLLGVVAATLLVTLVLVHYADFGGPRRKQRSRESILDAPIPETVTGYAVSLLVSLMLLWAFGWSDGASVAAITSMVVNLGAVAAVGAAIARLLVIGGNEAGAA
jgi:putative integral membrane protein (TIGR02587 family)